MKTDQAYEIHVRGHLDPDWAEWLEGMQVRWLENGETALTGTLADQAALVGVLNKLNRLNLAIVSVRELSCSEAGRAVEDRRWMKERK